ncbi:nitroreductase family deazaflavin-dependent oxidoreductase [Nocardia puris]|uniref:Deazaflavin-dependent oxidoreductase (Nitroreductase family) n=1 Tax=Nocardia puris TaxID=208602 RepID=A0A366CZ01_9NOCA|nr:nitroreductase family deazaflavin-dependent oxidoreductase [Nocardia puris]RBO83031.1 deazaflavin-dependent oxidoreductase (nitroreductase family) [Nocardia puris]
MSQGKLSLWFQRTMNTRTTKRIRRKGGRYMGMDMFVLHTEGRRSGQPRETPLSWFPGDEGSWLVVASGGGDRNPDWYANLLAHPDKVAVESPEIGTVPVTPRRLEGADREQAWKRVVAAQPRYEKYQRKADKQYPLILLTAR